MKPTKAPKTGKSVQQGTGAPKDSIAAHVGSMIRPPAVKRALDGKLTK
jgi:hypothetical protein